MPGIYFEYGIFKVYDMTFQYYSWNMTKCYISQSYVLDVTLAKY